MRKIFSFILLLICVSFGLLTACGKSNTNRTISVSENSVAEFSLFTHPGSKKVLPLLFNLGHSYLSFTNTSNTTIDLAGYKCEPNETVCIGTWSISKHFGVWYNVESNYDIYDNHYDGRLSLTKQIGMEEVEKLTEFIVNNNKWTILKNCSYFALNCWNYVVESNEQIDTPLIYTPSYIAKQIKQFETYEINRPYITKTNFGFFSNEVYVSYTMEGDKQYA